MEKTVDIIPILVILVKFTVIGIIFAIPLLIIILLIAIPIYNAFFGKEEEKEKKEGFTLIELLVVLIILGLLAALVVPRVTGTLGRSKVKITKVQLKAIKDALEEYKLDNGNYPTTEQGLKALVSKPTTPPIPKNWRKYMDKVPKDAWGNDFIYIYPGEDGHPYELRSKGPDGEEGTEDDISVWDL